MHCQLQLCRPAKWAQKYRQLLIFIYVHHGTMRASIKVVGNDIEKGIAKSELELEGTEEEKTVKLTN